MNVSLDEHRLGALRWIVLRGPGTAAFRAPGEHMRSELAADLRIIKLLAEHAPRNQYRR